MKVIVIGNGIVGASAAYHLASAGAEVAVADDQRPGRATWAGAGIVSASVRHAEAGRDLYDLAVASCHAYPALLAKVGISERSDIYDVIGALYVAPVGTVEDTYVQLKAAVPPGDALELLDDVQTLALFPYLRSDLASVHVPSVARVNGEALRHALNRAALRLGATFVSGPASLDTDKGQVSGATIGGRGVDADAVVVAAGAWTPELLRPLGVDVPITPQRGQILRIDLPGTDTSRLPVILPVDSEHYMLPLADGRLAVGATRESDTGFDPRLTAGGVTEVLDQALGLAPGLADATLADLRVGLRPATPDGYPFLGPVPGRSGLWIASGMGASGLTVGPYSGKLIAESVLGKRPSLDLTPFAVDRHRPEGP